MLIKTFDILVFFNNIINIRIINKERLFVIL